MLKDFDIAFTNKIKAWWPNTIFAETAVVYNVAFNLVDDNPFENALQFPLVAIYRPSGFSLDKSQNFAARKRGLPYSKDEVTHELRMARFLVANLPYQIDIYAKTPEDLDDVTEHIMHALNLDQTLTVIQEDVKNNETYEEFYDITYDSGPVENSTFDDGDRIYHYALSYDIKHARLLNFKTTPAVETVESTVDVEDADPDDL